MSNLFKLNLNDLGKGVVVAVLIAVLQLVLSLLQNKGLELKVEDLKSIVDVALKGGMAYLLKNLLTDSSGNVLGMSLGKKD